MRINKIVIGFVLWWIVLAGVTIHFGPGWGLMDDSQNLDVSQQVFSGGHPVRDMTRNVMEDATGWGIFRPVYRVWAILTYAIFHDCPVGMYLFVAVMNALAMLLWGLLLHRYYDREGDDRNIAVFFYPLLFFVFTPFWNVFMYLSL